MEYHDRVLKCADCAAEFVFTSGEQSFYADKGFKNEPKRCKPCKTMRARDLGAGANSACSHGGPLRTETQATCSQCGKSTTVPFRPTQGRPVYCRDCFQHRRGMAASVGAG